MSTMTIRPFHELRSNCIEGRQRCRNYRDHYRAEGNAERTAHWQEYMDEWAEEMANVNVTRMKVLEVRAGR